jgi:hypothetical protein
VVEPQVLCLLFYVVQPERLVPKDDRTASIQLTVDFLTAAFAATLPMTANPQPQAEDAQRAESAEADCLTLPSYCMYRRRNSVTRMRASAVASAL